MLVEVTVEVAAPDRESAMLELKLAGFNPVSCKVKRASAPRITVTPMDPSVRASAVIDMPEGLDHLERKAYVRGYGKACVAYGRKHGNPSIRGGDGDVTELHRMTRAHEWARHPGCHKAAMASLRKEQTHPSRTSTTEVAA